MANAQCSPTPKPADLAQPQTILIRAYVSRAVFVVYFFLAVEVFLEAFGGTHVGNINGYHSGQTIAAVTGCVLTECRTRGMRGVLLWQCRPTLSWRTAASSLGPTS